MATVIFKETNHESGYADSEKQFRITYNENYNASTNKTTITLSKVEFLCAVNLGSVPFYGKIKIGNTVVANFLGGNGYVATVNANTWVTIGYPVAYGSATVDGYGSFTMTLAAPDESHWTSGINWFAASYQGKAFGIKTNGSNASQSITITKYALTTAVSPSGYGTVTAGASLPPNATKSLTATPSTQTAQYTYAFSKWSVSGTGAKLSSTTTNPTTFTMGSSAATVTATFTRTVRSYTVTCEDRIGSSTGTKLGTKTGTYSYGSSVSGASFGNSSAYDAYYTGYHYTGSSTTITVDGAETVYRYFAVNTYTVTCEDRVGNSSGALIGTKTASYNYGSSVSGASFGSSTAYDAYYTGYHYTGSSSAITVNGAKTVYRYFALNTYTITCEDRVGSSSGTLIGTKTATYNYGSSVSGASFGTSTAYDAYYTGYHYVSSSSVITVNKAATVYRYFALNTWQVSYNANGGSGAPSAQIKTYNVNLTLSSTKPSKSNSTISTYNITYNINYSGGSNPPSASTSKIRKYTFSKWNTSSDGSGTNYQSGGTYSSNSSATLYAQYSYTDSIAAIVLPTPSRDGYIFDGWYTAAIGGTKRGSGGASYTPSQTETLYAHWVIKTYTLSISQGNGSTIVVKKNNIILENGASISHFDVLSITITANTGYKISTHTVNNTVWNSGNYTVTGNVSVVSTATIITYSLSLSYSIPGVSLIVNRTSSPIGGGATGALSNGAKLYYNDQLRISYTISSSYQLLTATVNNIDISNNNPYSMSVNSNVVVNIITKLGAIVYIGNEAYQAFIGTLVNGNAVWQQYQAFIGNGSTYDQY